MIKVAKNASEYVVEEEDFDLDARPDTKADSPVVRSWEAESNSAPSYATDFKFTEQTQLVRFVDASLPPYAYKEHWLAGKTSGKRSYTCLNPKDRADLVCPLCLMDEDIPGQYAKKKWAMTIVNFSADPFQKQLLTGAKRLIDTLHAMDTNKSTGPLAGKYWALSKSGEKQSTVYHVTPVKERDLQEDWGIDPEEAKGFFSSVEAYPPSIIKTYSVAELREIADTLS